MPTPLRLKPKFFEDVAKFLNSEEISDIYLKVAIIVVLTMLAAFVNSFNHSNF